MTVQIISLIVITLVLIVDFYINGRKKINLDEDVKRIQGNEGLKKFNLSEHLLFRKKNIIVFILFVFLLKPVLHFTFFTNSEEFVNYDKEIIESKYFSGWYKMVDGNLVKNEWKGNWLARKAKEELYTEKGERYIIQSTNDANKFFYYPKEIRFLSFNSHLVLIFKSKIWIFIVSIGAMFLIVFLFNDKIKAR